MTITSAMNVAILGASNKPERYSFKAVRMLREQGHRPFPVHPALTEVDGLPVFPSLGALPEPVDTVTVYLSPRNQQPIVDELLNSSARRFIFNPGTENPELADQLRQRGKEVVQACTLVLLTTGQFTKHADSPPLSQAGSGSWHCHEASPQASGARAVPGSQPPRMPDADQPGEGLPTRLWPLRAGDGSRSGGSPQGGQEGGGL